MSQIAIRFQSTLKTHMYSCHVSRHVSLGCYAERSLLQGCVLWNVVESRSLLLTMLVTALSIDVFSGSWAEPVNDNSDRWGARRYLALPPMLAPRGLNREASAAYIGVSPTKFDELVHDQRMPRPKRVDGRRIWDRLALDEAFSALPSDGGAGLAKPWDVVL